MVEVGFLMVEEAEDLSVVVVLLHPVGDHRHRLAMEIQGNTDLDNTTWAAPFFLSSVGMSIVPYDTCLRL